MAGILCMAVLGLLLLLSSFLLAGAAANDIALPGCPDRCGNISIPYPFGTKPGCHLPGFLITCNTTFSPPKTFINTGNLEATSFSLSGTTNILALIAVWCYAPLGIANIGRTWIDITGLPYAFSNTRNKFTALGCDTVALNSRLIFDGESSNLYYTTGCVSFCNELSSVISNSCSGIGCCQTSIPRGMQRIDTILRALRNHSTTWNFSPCSYAFLADQEQYVFDVSDLSTDFYKRKRMPAVLDWAVGNNQTCKAAADSNTYTCGVNTFCNNSDNAPGYRCSCKTGYQGNPYLQDGCQDINECEDDDSSPCSDTCQNTPGSYVCSCPRGYRGDGKKSGSGCTKKTTKFPLVQVVLGSGLGLLFLLLGGFSLYWVLKKRRMLRLREKFFRQNGGLLLQQQLPAHGGVAETAARIFTAEELKLATDNYSDSRILGNGGNGTVYKGILPDSDRVVAIKKSHLIDTTQIEQFINEVVLLSQVIHKHVVRILGCCLETPVPLLVYEYIPNGTLHYHLHARPGSLSWEARLRIAAETAEALAYLHTSIARPIFHRDIKAANILLDSNYLAKVSDFGASRLIPLDREQITTLVQGTLGYLDPEYFQSGQLTEKSDVYSFGVVLAEMLTGQKPLSRERPQLEKNLAIYFLLRMKDGKLVEMLEPRVRNEGSREQVEAVAELAKRCMRLKGEERPTMKEVTAEILRVRRPERNIAWEEDSAATAALEMDIIRMPGVEISDSMEETETTAFYSSRFTREISGIGTTQYFGASATGDDSLDQHIMLSLEMQR